MKLSEKTREDIEALRPLIASSGRCLITVHRNPDTDAIGSALAWAMAMESLGISTHIWAADPLEAYLSFLPQCNRVRSTVDPGQTFDLIWALDCASFERIQQFEQLNSYIQNGVPLVNIDHHADNTLFGDYSVVTTISSVGELLVEILNQLEIPISVTMAECLYAAISFDTGRFLYSNTTRSTFAAVAQLVDLGVNPGDMGRKMFESVPVDGFKVLNLALSRMVFDHGRRLLYTSLPRNAGEESIKVVDFIRQVDGADIVCVFKELEDHTVRVNLRSKCEVSVNTIAHVFGGGGHNKAAGITMDGPLDDAIERVVSQVNAVLDAR